MPSDPEIINTEDDSRYAFSFKLNHISLWRQRNVGKNLEKGNGKGWKKWKESKAQTWCMSPILLLFNQFFLHQGKLLLHRKKEWRWQQQTFQLPLSDCLFVANISINFWWSKRKHPSDNITRAVNSSTSRNKAHEVMINAQVWYNAQDVFVTHIKNKAEI